MELEWFRLLNSDQNSLFRKKNIGRKSIPVCNEGNSYKEFAVFRTPLTLYDHCLTLPDDQRCLYEIIRANLYQKFYLDIDMGLCETSKEFDHDREQKIAIAKQIPSYAIDCIIKIKPEIKRTDILVFTSHAEDKRSFHIVVDRWCVSSAKNNRKFFDAFMQHIPVPWRQYFDASMYKSLQNFRLYMSTKVGKNRMKIFSLLDSPWKPDNNVDPIECNRQVFLASIITRTDNCILLPFEEDEEVKEFNEVELLESEIPKLMIIIKNMPYARCFTISERKNNLVVMRRLAPNFCKVCDRQHDGENPYITVCSSGDVMFDCRRNSDKIRVKIGNINDIEIENKPEINSIEVPFFECKTPQSTTSSVTSNSICSQLSLIQPISENLKSPTVSSSLVISPLSIISRVSSFTSNDSNDYSFCSPLSDVNVTPRSENVSVYEKIGKQRRDEMKKRKTVGTVLMSLM